MVFFLSRITAVPGVLTDGDMLNRILGICLAISS